MTPTGQLLDTRGYNTQSQHRTVTHGSHTGHYTDETSTRDGLHNMLLLNSGRMMS